MKLRAQFTERYVVQPRDYVWVTSPAAGVERMMLDRVGDEVARATSIVRYEPHSTFPEHVHTGGEEILVLSGTFGDEHGLYPAGTYLRKPPGTRHSPKVGSAGAEIFVKLRQFHANDTAQVLFPPEHQETRSGLVEGLEVTPLHSFRYEHVALVRWAPQTQFSMHTHAGGEEIFVLEGTLYDGLGAYPKGTWLRSPHMSRHEPFTRHEGALIYVKTGHLADLIHQT